jgi:DNA end-binding protein Ku
MGLVARKAKAGKTQAVIEPQEEMPAAGGNVIDLTELLQQSLKGNKPRPVRRRTARKRAA